MPDETLFTTCVVPYLPFQTWGVLSTFDLSKWHPNLKCDVFSRNRQLERKVHIPEWGTQIEQQRSCDRLRYEYLILESPFDAISNGVGKLSVTDDDGQTRIVWEISFDWREPKDAAEDEIMGEKMDKTNEAIMQMLQSGFENLNTQMKATKPEVVDLIHTADGSLVASVPFEIGLPQPPPSKKKPKARNALPPEWDFRYSFPIREAFKGAVGLDKERWHRQFIEFCVKQGIFELTPAAAARPGQVAMPYKFDTANGFQTGRTFMELGSCLVHCIRHFKLEVDLLYTPEAGQPFAAAVAAAFADDGIDLPYCWARRDDNAELGLSLGGRPELTREDWSTKVLILMDRVTEPIYIAHHVKYVSQHAKCLGVVFLFNDEERATDELTRIQEAEHILRLPMYAVVSLTNVYNCVNRTDKGSDPVVKLKNYLTNYCWSEADA
uniref:Uncharacterized protein n=1 Tax=Eutreptiella gymnastica TaxID=73025 RepID=A0A7S1IXE7_9EUGL|mmetsp:Transcript_50964/g.91113  ORF Transcript_50964/g.91113 Transcript_50964/m.91113 type:complete len:437 (+) Transcript_50964:52-1362(+)